MLKHFVKFVSHLFMSLVYRVEIIGLENYATAQPKILCPNHINYLDPVVIGSYLPEFVRFMAKKEIFSNRLFHWFFTTCGGFPVDRQGNDIGAVKTTIRILKNSESVLIFAEGTRNPGLTPLPAKPGVAMIAHRAAVPIQPITVDSTYKLFSKIRVIFHPIVWLQFAEKPSVHDYESAVAGILTTIYDAITLYKGRDLS